MSKLQFDEEGKPLMPESKNENDEELESGEYEGIPKINRKILTEKVEPEIGNCMPLKNIPLGLDVHNIELRVGQGGQMVRSAGGMAKLLAKEGDYAHIVLPSGEVRKVFAECRATIGIIAGGGRKEKPLVKAGKAWHLMHAKGKLYPKTSGAAMNAVDHPFGSGRGRHVGKSKVPPRNAPPGRNIGLLAARRTGRKR